MHYMFIALVMFTVSSITLAGESWLCTEDSSQIQGSQILACGVGEGMNESIARKLALKNAEEEFSVVCDTQTLCGEHKYSAAPSRSTCSESNGVWKCYRLVVYSIERDSRVAMDQHNSTIVSGYTRNMMDEALEHGIGRGW